MKLLKQIITTIIMIAILMLGSSVVSANPYTGYNRIGSYYHTGENYFGGVYGSGYHAPSVSINVPSFHFDYPTVPRAGGWFGNGVTWATGLRAPYYGCVSPTTTTTFYRDRCFTGYGYGSGYGYSTGNYRVRSGGAFVY